MAAYHEGRYFVPLVCDAIEVRAAAEVQLVADGYGGGVQHTIEGVGGYNFQLLRGLEDGGQSLAIWNVDVAAGGQG